MSDPKRPPRTEAELRTIAMPADTNPSGDIFGGWLLSQMDVAGGSYAMARIGGRVATVGIEAMSFHRPVYVGDRVSCHCRTERVGRTSIAVHVETWVRRTRPGQTPEEIKVTEGMFTFVALGEGGVKRVIES
jgi:acyl-CoA thioesterase YciA